MAYEKVSSTRVVILGGVNKETGVKNPIEIEGYWLRTELRKTKYGMKDFYVFLTQEGEAGIFSSGYLANEMKKAKLNLMTLVTDTGKTIPSGKGNPTKIYDVKQDKTNVLDPEVAAGYSASSESSYEETEESNDYQETYTPAPVAAPRAAPVSNENKASVDAFLAARKAAANKTARQ